MLYELVKNKVYYRIFDNTCHLSSGIYSLHKYQDAAKILEVKQNIERVRQEITADRVVILKQVHGSKVVDIRSIDYPSPQEADAAVTAKNNIALGIVTADCVPVLLAGRQGEVIGAAHCGWRSAKAGILKNLYDLMRSKGAEQIKAVIGPAIQQKSYEVDASYMDNFISEDKRYEKFFVPSKITDRFMFDLVGYVKATLARLDITVEHCFTDDTYSMVDRYPSYRRSIHEGSIYNRNILSTIIIK